MGYYTCFELKLTMPDGKALPQVELTLIHADLLMNENAAYALDLDGGSAGDYHSSESCKWYEWEEDLRAISARHPEALFTMHGEGEQSGDVWVAYFLAGKAQIEKAVFKLAAFNRKWLR